MNTKQPYLVFADRFIVPEKIEIIFETRMNFNRGFIQSLPGFIADEVFKTTLNDGSFQYLTIAKWENQEALQQAKALIQKEYERIGFDPAVFTRRNNIQLERQEYKVSSNKTKISILIFGKDTPNLKKVIHLLQSQHFYVEGTTALPEAVKSVKNNPYDVLIVGGAVMVSKSEEKLIAEARAKQIKIIAIDKRLPDRVKKKGQQEMEIYYLEEVVPRLKRWQSQNSNR